MEHTPTPWKLETRTPESDAYDSYRMSNENEDTVFLVTYRKGENQRLVDAQRIVACVNACERMEDPENEIQALRDRVKELEGAISNTVMEADTKADEIEGWDSAEGRGASSISRLVSDRLLPYIYPAN